MTVKIKKHLYGTPDCWTVNDKEITQKREDKPTYRQSDIVKETMTDRQTAIQRARAEWRK